jgi:DNA-binding NtrC family response regulator
MAPVLVTGETGTGKDLIAQAIYHDGKLAGGKFVKIDVPACMAGQDRLPAHWLSETLSPLAAESSTPSDGARPPNRCTVMMDGIDHLPLDHQEPFVDFLGGNKYNGAAVDDPGHTIRLVCTCRRDIAQMVDSGRFRKDLYHLLSVFAIVLPPLRERSDDILLLADYFEGIYCLELSRTVMDVSSAARELMLAYSWPGNVAELKQVIFDALTSGQEDFLSQHLQDAIGVASGADHGVLATGFNSPYLMSADEKDQTLSLKKACKTIVEKTERKFIADALDRTNWNRRRAARILDVSYRTLLNKIKAYGLK